MAFLTAVMFHPLYLFLARVTGERAQLASFLSILVIILMVLLPLGILAQMTVQQIFQVTTDVRNYTQTHEVSLEAGVNYVNDFLDTVPYIESDLTVEQAQSSIDRSVATAARWVADQALRTGATSLELVTQFFTYLFLLFFLFPLQRKIPELISELSPLSNEVDYLLMNKALAMAQSMIRGTFVIAVIQGAVGGIMLFLVGVPYAMFWTLLMIVMGIIPVVGATTVLYPAAILLMATGAFWPGAILMLVTTFIVTNIDNVLRPQLVSKEAELHPALVLIAVLGGIKVFGLIGVIYGPVIMILLTTMLSVFEHDKRSFQTEG